MFPNPSPPLVLFGLRITSPRGLFVSKLFVHFFSKVSFLHPTLCVRLSSENGINDVRWARHELGWSTLCFRVTTPVVATGGRHGMKMIQQDKICLYTNDAHCVFVPPFLHAVYWPCREPGMRSAPFWPCPQLTTRSCARGLQSRLPASSNHSASRVNFFLKTKSCNLELAPSPELHPILGYVAA